MIEEPHGIVADVAGQSDKGIEQEPFLCARRLSIVGSHAFNELAPGLITQGQFHRTLQSVSVWLATFQ